VESVASFLCLDKIAKGVYIRYMIRINTHLTEIQLKILRQLAEKTGLSVAEHIRRAIDEYLKTKNERTLS
jgi:hypothetical protein